MFPFQAPFWCNGGDFYHSRRDAHSVPHSLHAASLHTDVLPQASRAAQKVLLSAGSTLHPDTAPTNKQKTQRKANIVRL